MFAGASLALVVGSLIPGCSEAPSAKTAQAAPASPPNAGYAESPTSEGGTAAPTPPPQPSQYDVSSTNDLRTVADAQASLSASEAKITGLLGTGPKAVRLSGDGCDVACAALASMKRATDRLCDLSTDEPPRCTDARARVDRASARVREVCSDCATG